MLESTAMARRFLFAGFGVKVIQRSTPMPKNQALRRVAGSRQRGGPAERASGSEASSSDGSALLRAIRLIRSGGVPVTEFRTEGARAFSVVRDEAESSSPGSRSHANATPLTEPRE